MVNRGLDEELLLQRMRELAPDQFEEFVAGVWQQRGWKMEVTAKSKDRGIDVIASRNDPFPEKTLIQAKRYREGNNVGSRAIREYNSLKEQEESVDQVVIVTTSGFTKEAQLVAEDLNVKCVDGTTLVGLVKDVDAPTLIQKCSIDAQEIGVESHKQKETAVFNSGDSYTTVSETGDGVVTELRGIERVRIEPSSELSIKNQYFEGIFVAITLDTHDLQDGVWLTIDGRNEVDFVDTAGIQHTPIEISQTPLAKNWQTHDPENRLHEGLREIEFDIQIGTNSNYLAALEIPSVKAISAIEIRRYNLRLNLPNTLPTNLNSLPNDLRTSIESIRDAHLVE